MGKKPLNDIIRPKMSSNTKKERKGTYIVIVKKDKKNNASKDKSWFLVHFALVVKQLCVLAFRSPSGIELLTLVQGGLAHDQKTERRVKRKP